MAEFENYSSNTVMRLRAHHICCVPFFVGTFADRPESFQQVEHKIKGLFSALSDSKVMVIEGVDELCQECPLRTGDRCASPLGDEDLVRKWDAILLKELDVPFNTCLTSSQWRDLTKQKVPFKICPKCQWRGRCSVGRNLP